MLGMNLTYMRRIISFLLCLLTILFVLAGCGNRAQDQEEDYVYQRNGIPAPHVLGTGGPLL